MDARDLRRTDATMMQALGVMPDVIDRCQNHVLAGSRVRRLEAQVLGLTLEGVAWETGMRFAQRLLETLQ